MATEDRLAHLDAALKDCIQQISTLQEERQLEAELKDANKRLVCTLVCKQELVDELERDKQHLEAELDALLTRIDSVEKENAFLKCECCALERDLVLHLDSADKVAKLEAECQQLRLLVLRNLQGHGNHLGDSRRMLDPVNGALFATATEPSENSSRKIDILVDRLCDVQEENKALREIIKARENELCSSEFKCAQMAYRLAAIEAELKVVDEGDKSKLLLDDPFARSCLSVGINGSDHLSPDALTSDLECLPNDNANIQVDYTCHGASKNSLINHFMNDSQNQLESASKQIVLASQAYANERSMGTNGCWPWNVLHEIMEQRQFSKRSITELLEEIKILLAPQSCSETTGLLAWHLDQAIPSGKMRAKPGGSNLSLSICRLIELIEEISPSSLIGSLATDENQCHNNTNHDYSVHVFRWRNSELIPILQKFVLSCSLVLSGSHGLEEFAVHLTSLLEWAVEKCITLDDASRVRDRIRKHFNLDRSKSESEIDVTSGDCQNVMTKMIKIQNDLQEENTWLNHKLRSVESANKDLETKLSSAMENNELLISQIEDSKESIRRLEEELDDLHESKGATEDQIEHQKLINEDLDTQLTVAKVKQNEMMQKLSSLEIELEDRHQCCEELETTCLELQLQLEILSRKGSPYLEEDLSGNDKQTGWEMIADCTKLALICDPSMENDPSDELDISATSVVVKKFVEKEKGGQRCSLRDRMIAEDDGSETKQIVCVGEMEKEKQPAMLVPDTGATGALALVQIKKQGVGFGFIRKMFLRRRKCSTNKASSTLLQRTASSMMR